MENKIFCTRCGAENSSQFSFCVGCGSKLEKEQPKPAEPCSADACDTFPPAPMIEHDSLPNTRGGAIGNMPIEAAAEFIGPKADSYIPKFTDFERKRSSASWNWPVALWSFLLGMPFVWFFYRKMYKLGAILLAICTALTVANAVCVAGVIENTAEIMMPYMEQILLSPDGSVPDELIYEILNTENNVISGLAAYTTFSNLLGFLSLILSTYISITANRHYMKHMLKVFNKTAIQRPQGITPSELRELGGISTGAGAGVAIGFVVLSGIIMFATAGVAFADFVDKIIELAMTITF